MSSYYICTSEKLLQRKPLWWAFQLKKEPEKKKKEEIFAQRKLRHVSNSAHKPRGSV